MNDVKQFDFELLAPGSLRKYPDAPGFKEGDTSRAAERSIEDIAGTLRSKCLARLETGPATADETAMELGETVLAIRPRFTELKARGRIYDTGTRRRNASGRMAKVWAITQKGQE